MRGCDVFVVTPLWHLGGEGEGTQKQIKRRERTDELAKVTGSDVYLYNFKGVVSVGEGSVGGIGLKLLGCSWVKESYHTSVGGNLRNLYLYGSTVGAYPKE